MEIFLFYKMRKKRGNKNQESCLLKGEVPILMGSPEVVWE
jgi:hypothetical protein